MVWKCGGGGESGVDVQVGPSPWPCISGMGKGMHSGRTWGRSKVLHSCTGLVFSIHPRSNRQERLTSKKCTMVREDDNT